MSRITQKAIYEILSNASGVTTLIGVKIYPTFIPQEVNFPAAVYRITDKVPMETKDGVFGSTDTLQITIFDDEAVVTANIGDAIRDALEGYSGTVQSVKIDKIIYEGESDDPLILDLELYQLTQQYRVRVRY